MHTYTKLFLTSLLLLAAIPGSAMAFEAGTSPADGRTGRVTKLVIDDNFLTVEIEISSSFPGCEEKTLGSAQLPVTDGGAGHAVQFEGIRSLLLGAYFSGNKVEVRARGIGTRCMLDWVGLS